MDLVPGRELELGRAQFSPEFRARPGVYDPALARQIDGLISAGQGKRISMAQLDARSLPERLRDGAARLMLPYL